MPGVYGSAEPLFLLLFALGIEALYGGVFFLEKWLPKPRRLLAGIIVRFDRLLNDSTSSSSIAVVTGGLSAIVLIFLAALVGFGISLISLNAPFLWLIEVFMIALCLDYRNQQVRMRKVRKALALKSYITVRGELYPLVSSLFRVRDLEKLSESQLAAACVGGMARGFVEGFLTPVFWYAILGLPGLFVQQAVYQGALFYKQRYLQAPQEKHFSQMYFILERIFIVVPDALAALMFIVSTLFIPKTSFSQSFIRCWRGKHMADAALGGALQLDLSQPSPTNWRQELERGNMIVLIAGIMAVGLIAGAILVRFAF
ncbi:cobalamin biosynthesis protein [Kiloniella sp.]|uniref:cobalamin biosynthesis protein n=1 Tax=Kiloniella sp. TaxID=1938587 RepID=UPI003A957395